MTIIWKSPTPLDAAILTASQLSFAWRPPHRRSIETGRFTDLANACTCLVQTLNDALTPSCTIWGVKLYFRVNTQTIYAVSEDITSNPISRFIHSAEAGSNNHSKLHALPLLRLFASPLTCPPVQRITFVLGHPLSILEYSKQDPLSLLVTLPGDAIVQKTPDQFGILPDKVDAHWFIDEDQMEQINGRWKGMEYHELFVNSYRSVMQDRSAWRANIATRLASLVDEDMLKTSLSTFSAFDNAVSPSTQFRLVTSTVGIQPVGTSQGVLVLYSNDLIPVECVSVITACLAVLSRAFHALGDNAVTGNETHREETSAPDEVITHAGLTLLTHLEEMEYGGETTENLDSIIWCLINTMLKNKSRVVEFAELWDGLMSRNLAPKMNVENKGEQVDEKALQQRWITQAMPKVNKYLRDFTGRSRWFKNIKNRGYKVANPVD